MIGLPTFCLPGTNARDIGKAMQDRGESVRELTEFPQMTTGAPSPLILADENRLALAYYLNATASSADGSFATIRSRNPAADVEPVAFVKVEFTAIRFGYPNDEGLIGHRLFEKGLRAYGVWEVLNSDWPVELERANRKHPEHFPGLFDGLQHIVFTFQDSTLEVLSSGFEVEVHHQSVFGMLPPMQDFLLNK